LLDGDPLHQSISGAIGEKKEANDMDFGPAASLIMGFNMDRVCVTPNIAQD
jgi:hypothetical protein